MSLKKGGDYTLGANMRAVDTNVLVRLITGDDLKQAIAAEQFVAAGAWVSLLVLAEAVWVLTTVYDRPSSLLVKMIEILLKHKDLTMQDPDVVAAALERYRKRPVLGFSDCLVLEIARKAGHVPLGTFDRDLAKLDGVHRL